MMYHNRILANKLEKLRKQTGRKKEEYGSGNISGGCGRPKETYCTQEEFAEKIGIAKNTYSNFEKGYKLNNIKLETLKKISKQCGVSIGYLLGEYDCPTREIQDIHEVTGLSEEAIKTLIQNKKDEILYDDFISNFRLDAEQYEQLEDLIERNDLKDLFDAKIEEYKEKYGEKGEFIGEAAIFNKFLNSMTLDADRNDNVYMTIYDRSPRVHDYDVFFNPAKIRIAVLNYILHKENDLFMSLGLLDAIGKYIYRLTPERLEKYRSDTNVPKIRAEMLYELEYYLNNALDELKKTNKGVIERVVKSDVYSENNEYNEMNYEPEDYNNAE